LPFGHGVLTGSGVVNAHNDSHGVTANANRQEYDGCQQVAVISIQLGGMV